MIYIQTVINQSPYLARLMSSARLSRPALLCIPLRAVQPRSALNWNKFYYSCYVLQFPERSIGGVTDIQYGDAGIDTA